MTSFLSDAGYWALIIFAFAQACCIPISSEITFGFAGVLAFEGHLSLPLVIIIGTIGELAGSSAAYGLGRLGGRHTVERYRRYLLMTRKDVARAEAFFGGRGAWSVALARVIPLLRTFAGLAAGFMEVPTLAFEAFSLLGTVVWAAALSLVGYELGSDWAKVSKNISHASDALAAVVVLMLVVLIVHKAWQLRRERVADATAGRPAGAADPGNHQEPAAAAALTPAAQPEPGPQPPDQRVRPHSHRRRPG